MTLPPLNSLYSKGEVKLEEKLPGKHRWIVMVTYTIEARKLGPLMAGAEVALERGTRIGVMAGCFDCQNPWVAVHDKPCVTPEDQSQSAGLDASPV